MLADIVPRRDPAIVEPCDHDRLLQAVPHHEIARLGDIDRRTGREPGMMEYRLHFPLEQVRIGVVAGRYDARRERILRLSRRRKCASSLGVEVCGLFGGKVGHGVLVQAVRRDCSASR